MTEDTVQRMVEALLLMDRIEAGAILEKTDPATDAFGCVDKIIIPALESIGLQWEKGDVSLAQVYMSGRICEELVDQFLPPKSPRRTDRPRMAIALLDDFHSLGKSIIYSVLRAKGFELDDFGTLDTDTLIEKTIEQDIKILLISVLMYSSATHIRKVCQGLKQKGMRTRIIVGGAPFRFDQELWQQLGADGVGTNTAEALQVIEQMVEELS